MSLCIRRTYSDPVCILFALLSDLSSTASPHILWLTCVADGIILLYMLVDLASKINRTFFVVFFPSVDKCTRTYDEVISIGGEFGQISRLTACGSIGFHMPPSCYPASFILLLLAGLRAIECEALQEKRCLGFGFIHALLLDAVIFQAVFQIRCYRMKSASYHKKGGT